MQIKTNEKHSGETKNDHTQHNIHKHKNTINKQKNKTPRKTKHAPQ